MDLIPSKGLGLISLDSSINRILIIGNAAGGKTRLSLRLSQIHGLPITHVDSIQFQAGMKIRPYSETTALLKNKSNEDRWIIDGFGPLDLIEKRFELADRIVFIDLPIALHYFWFLIRQLKNIWSPRPELPENCNELTWEHSKKILRTMKSIHLRMRPELIRILSKDLLKNKVVTIRSLHEFKRVSQMGLN